MGDNSRQVWLNVEDTAAWVRADTTSDPQAATVTLKRRDNQQEVSLPQAEFARLAQCYTSEVDEVADDLTRMGEVSDATMLDTLRRRYARDDIYCAIGPVIVSVNPYKKVPGCSSEAITTLCQQGSEAPPHIAKVAHIAYNGLTNFDAEQQAQSVLISGESGAGKTEACKLCLLSLAELSKSSGAATEAALESAVLLESFGNAKTVYNDNSSRFGKWCAVYFNHRFQISACQSNVYLLEKTRIIHAPAGERSYHIFYQILTGATGDAKKEVQDLGGLLNEMGGSKGWSGFTYTRDGLGFVDGMDDGHEYTASMGKLDVLGLGGEAQVRMLRLVTAVLILGNIEFEPLSGSADDKFKVKNGDVLKVVCSLLEVEAPALEAKMTMRTISTGKGSSTYTVPLKKNECYDTRDALAKSVYAELFEWIVAELNESQKMELDKSSSDDESRFVGLLDIFGFENFHRNSFEQLCINFTNERLQAHFMDSLVKLRIEEYNREGIDSKAIDFPDNAAQIALLDHKSRGVFAMLDDECSVPNGSEQQLVDKLGMAFMKEGYDCFDRPKRAKGGVAGEKHGTPFPSHGAQLDRLAFVVVHYAEAVCYTVDGWLDKNRGYLHPDVAYVLTQSDAPLVRTLYPMSCVDVTKKSTVGSTFRKSLRQLSATMLTTAQNYVRCIKPNGVRKADAFDGHFVLRQLRYTGVGAVVAIQRSGYPISMSLVEFVGRYRCIALDQPTLLKGSPKEVTSALLKAAPAMAGEANEDWLGRKDCQIGLTRVYMREGVVKALEGPRAKATQKAAVALQRREKGKQARAVATVLRVHARGSAAVRAQLDKHDTDKAQECLDALVAQWAGVRVPLSLALHVGGEPPLMACKADLSDLENELRALEEGLEEEAQGLEEEAQALEELQAALAAASTANPKEAYVKLKIALQSAHQKKRGLRSDLIASIEAAEEALQSCLVGNGMSPELAKAALAKLRNEQEKYIATHRRSTTDLGVPNNEEEIDWEAHAARMAAEKLEKEAEEAAAACAAADAAATAEVARQAKELAQWEAEVERQAMERERAHRAELYRTEEELVAAAAEGAVQIVLVTLANDLIGATGKTATGYTEKSTGLAFSDRNTVAKLRKGGLAALHGMLHVGDTIIAVNQQPLKGERVADRLNAVPAATYELTIARSMNAGHKTAGGEMQGWLQMVKAADGSPLPLSWPKRLWVVLDAHANLSFYDSKRSLKANRVQNLKGGECKTPITKLRGEELKQPPVIASFISEARFPFTLVWPQKEVDHDVVLAAATSEDRSAWVKALKKTLKELAAQAPTSGWLVKQGGRAKHGLGAFFSTNKRRWFVLVQPDEGHDAVFRYYDSPPSSLAAHAKGAVIINHNATLQLEPDSVLGKNGFSIKSQGASDPHPITTVLAGDSNADVGRWMKAIALAIKQSGGQMIDVKAVAKERIVRGSLATVDQKQINRAQLAKLDIEELRELPLKELHQVCKHLDIVFDKRVDRDRRKLADLIVGQRNAHKADAGAGAHLHDDDVFLPMRGLKTWGTMRLDEAGMNGKSMKSMNAAL